MKYTFSKPLQDLRQKALDYIYSVASKYENYRELCDPASDFPQYDYRSCPKVFLNPEGGDERYELWNIISIQCENGLFRFEIFNYGLNENYVLVGETDITTDELVYMADIIERHESERI